MASIHCCQNIVDVFKNKGGSADQYLDHLVFHIHDLTAPGPAEDSEINFLSIIDPACASVRRIEMAEDFKLGDRDLYKKLLEICWSHESSVDDFKLAASEVTRLVSGRFVLLKPTLAILAIQAGNANVLGHVITGTNDSGNDIGGDDGNGPKQPSILESHPDVLRAATRLSDPSLLLLLISTKLLHLQSPESWTNQLNASLGKSADLVSALLVLGALPNRSTFYRAALLPPSGAQLETWIVLLDFQVPIDPTMIIESGCLAVAASRGRSDVVELLLDRGIPGLSVHSSSATGVKDPFSGSVPTSLNPELPLHAAVLAKHEQTVSLLLTRGAGTGNGCQDASEALHWATEQGQEWQGVVKALQELAALN